MHCEKIKPIDDLVANHGLGADFYVMARDLRMSDQEFDAWVSGIVDDGPGTSFVVVRAHRDDTSSKRIYDMLRVRRVR